MLSPWNKIAVIVAIIGTIVSIASLAYQIHRARFSQAIDLLLKFESNFFGDEKREQRSKAARRILNTPSDYAESEDIVDFFETIALLTRKGALDKYMVWHTFYYWINNYYEIAKQHIDARRKKDVTIWQDIGPFVENLRKLQMKQAGLSSLAQTIPTAQELEQFLNEERSEGKPRSKSTSGF
jgi:hypothetical protein